MKKFLVILMTLALLLTLAVASAESALVVNWEDVDVESTGIEGTWYTFDDVELQVWIPNVIQNVAFTEEEAEEGVIGKFVTEDESTAIYASYHQGQEGATMEDLISTIEGNGAKEIERVILNGLGAVSYSIPDVDAGYMTFVTESGNYVMFTFAPISNKDDEQIFQLVSASIMPEK